jgi:hypothetical protein
MSRLPFAAILTAIACAATLCAAVCPSNGDTRVLYVTANGDRGFHDILMLDTSGRPVGTAINWTSVPKEVVLLKLRGMAFGPDGRMYLASAMGSHSKIVVFSKDVASDCTRQFEEVLTALGPDQRRLKHPYSLVVVPGWLMKPSKGDEGTKKHPRFVLMVSNQNSVSVTWMNGLDGTPLPAPDHTLHRHTGQAAFSTPHEKGKPVPPAVDADKNSTLPPAEPVSDDGAGAKAEAVTRSERADLNGVFTIAGSAEEQAMANVEDQYRLLSVRGAALAPDDRWLVLADVDGDALRVFDVRNGKYSWSIPVPAPIQVAFAPAGFLNLDGRHPAADLVPHALITTKTQNIYVVPIVDPRDRDLIYKITRPPRAGYRYSAVFGDSNDDAADTQQMTFSRIAQSKLPADLLPRVFTRGFVSTSAIDFDAAAGVVYVGDRVLRQMYRIRFDGANLGPFGPRLKDQPEHALLVQLVDPEDLPRCHELGAFGPKFSVLCVAGYMWVFAIIIGAVVLCTARAAAHKRDLARILPRRFKKDSKLKLSPSATTTPAGAASNDILSPTDAPLVSSVSIDEAPPSTTKSKPADALGGKKKKKEGKALKVTEAPEAMGPSSQP